MDTRLKTKLLAASTLCGLALAEPALAQATNPTQLDELVVTANRREQNLQDVGAALQVLSGEQLDRQGVSKMADFILQVPGVSLREQGNGATRLALRGVSNVAAADSGAGSTVSTVGLYFGEVPIQGTSVLPDLATYDLARVEVLKGPQGTLYGEGAMGGAIRMLPNTVDLAQFSGSAETQISRPRGGDLGYLARGAVNIPLITDRVGVRLVGSYRDEGGYVDNVTTGRNNINKRDGYAVRGVLRIEPTDRLNIELLGLYNKEDVDGFNQIDSRLPGTQITGLEDRYNNTRFKLFAATANYDFGPARLTLASSKNTYDRDFADRFPAVAAILSPFGAVRAEPELFDVDQETTAHEIRLVSNGDHRLDWVVGAFYRDRQSRSFISLNLLPADLISVNAGLGRIGIAGFPDEKIIVSKINDFYKQNAIYGEGTLALTDEVDLTLGVRWFKEKVRFESSTLSYTVLTSLNNSNVGHLTDDGVIPKLNLTWRASADHTFYAQAAKGFRSGGVNFQAVLVSAEPTYKSDGLWNYEVGWKAQFLDRRLSASASAFYIDWSDIQSNYFVFNSVLRRNVGLVNNGGSAFIRGLELEFTARPVQGLTLGGSMATSKSRLKEPAPNSDTLTGQSLPNAPRFTAAAYGEFRWPVKDDLNGVVRLDVQHTASQRLRFLSRTFDGFPVAGYELINARLGVETDRWSAQLFVSNLADKRAQYGRGLSLLTSTANPELLTIAKPRTLGLQLRTSF